MNTERFGREVVDLDLKISMTRWRPTFSLALECPLEFQNNGFGHDGYGYNLDIVEHETVKSAIENNVTP